MDRINLSEIIASKGLKTKEVARELFPDNSYPSLALNRILSGEAVLNADQISRLSLYADIPIGELFSGGKWTAKAKKDLLIFTSGEYRAELDVKAWTSKLYHKDSIYHEFFILSKTIGLNDYINQLEEIIKNGKSNGNS